MAEAAGRWASLHVYHAGPLEYLLSDAVGPLVRGLAAAGEVRRWFFLRYGDGGPHLRLRLQGEPARLEASAVPAAVRALGEYLERHPSIRDDAAQGTPWRSRAPLAPNDSVRPAPYEPETERYGGPAGLALAEEHFHASSAAVLEVMEARRGRWSYEQAMGTAIQMHLALACGLGLTLPAAAALFAGLTETYLPHAAADLTQSSFARLEPQARAHLLAAFAQALAPARARLLAYHRAVWRGLRAGAEFDQPWMNRWTTSARENAAAFRAADESGELEYPRWWFELHPEVPDRAGDRLVFIVSSLLHMTNNRLGILNRDEAYLLYVLASCLGLLAQEEGAAAAAPIGTPGA